MAACWSNASKSLPRTAEPKAFAFEQSCRDVKEQSMQLGTFSASLAVKDLEASRSFYEKFGFTPFAGNASQNWLIMKNGSHVIGLFQGMFEGTS